MTRSRLERRVRLLGLCVAALVLSTGFLAWTALGPKRSIASSGGIVRAGSDSLVTDVLVAREIVVTDGEVVRVRLGAGLPDAIIDGERVARGGVAAGLLIYDGEGYERGGYVTFESGNALLTLDSRRGQQMFVAADTAGPTALRIWHGDDAVEIRADADGARITAVEGGTVVHQRPEIRRPEATEMCATLRDLAAEVERDRLVRACRQRMKPEACARCLEGGR